MLSIGLLFLLANASKSLVLAPVSNLSPETAQDSPAEDVTLETIASKLPQNSSFTLTTLSSLPITNSSLESNDDLDTAWYRCDSDLGSNLNVHSCTDAVRTIDYADSKQSLWGLRGSDIGYEFPVPRRWVSPDGKCVIETILFEGNSAVASPKDVAGGAATIITQCIQDAKSNKGGFAKKFGGDNRLGVYVAAPLDSPSNVRCYGSAAGPAMLDSCQSILDKMDVDNVRKVFGRRGVVGADVVLPYTWPSADHKCIMTLRISGQSDTYSSGKIWEAASMATAMCLTQGKKALFAQMGREKKLYLEIAAEGAGDVEIS